MSIRTRLTFWYAVVLLVGLAAFAGGTWFAMRHRLIAELDSRLAARVEGLRTVVELETRVHNIQDLPLELAEFSREVPEGDHMRLRNAQGQVLLASPALDALSIPEGLSTSGNSRILAAKFDVNGLAYDVVVAASLRDVDRTLGDLRALMRLAIPAVLLVACLGGYWLSRRALAPVDDITTVARSISVENLSRRLVVPSTGDEIERMSLTWNEVLERLESAVKRIRQFTADASHELRTPLAFVRATADLALRRERTAEEYRKALADIRDEADRITALTESLLVLARSDDGSMKLELGAVALAPLIEAAVDEVRPLARDLSVHTEVSGAGTARANAPALRRLLLALLDNAIKYTAQGGITITAKGTTVDVADTGIGISPDALPHIFERFYRVDAARSHGSGAGLGLAIAQAIAQAHGTVIEADSTPGSGSRFRLRLEEERG